MIRKFSVALVGVASLAAVSALADDRIYTPAPAASETVDLAQAKVTVSAGWRCDGSSTLRGGAYEGADEQAACDAAEADAAAVCGGSQVLDFFCRPQK